MTAILAIGSDRTAHPEAVIEALMRDDGILAASSSRAARVNLQRALALTRDIETLEKRIQSAPERRYDDVYAMHSLILERDDVLRHVFMGVNMRKLRAACVRAFGECDDCKVARSSGDMTAAMMVNCR